MAYSSGVTGFSAGFLGAQDGWASHDTLLVQLRLGTTWSQLDNLLVRYQADIAGARAGISGQVPAMVALRLPTATHAELRTEMTNLRAEAIVEIAAPDMYLFPDALPTRSGSSTTVDPDWTWEFYVGGNHHLEMINAPPTWGWNNGVDRAGDYTRTGFLEAGVDESHPDITIAVNLNPGLNGCHGTNVASVMGAGWGDDTYIDATSPYTELVFGAYTQAPIQGGWRDRATTMGDLLINDLVAMLDAGTGMRALNVSLGYNWLTNFGFDPATEPDAMDIVNDHGLLMLGELNRLATSGIDLPVIATSAGNDYGYDARWNSPWANAAIVWSAQPIIVVESVDAPSSPGVLTSASRSAFSNYGGHVAAPGDSIRMLTPVDASTRCDPPGSVADFQDLDSGTSFSSPQVAALASYMYSVDPTLPSPTLSSNPVKDMILANTIAVASSTPIIDMFNSVMDVDTYRGDLRTVTLLTDIDDGTPDGNQRLVRVWGSLPGSDYTAEDADLDGFVGDGVVDMSDFRRWRDWLLQVESYPLSGSATHPKFDINENGAVECDWCEALFARGDFNGDGVLQRTLTRPVSGAAAGASATDLAILMIPFNDPDYAALDLPFLVYSGDIEVWPKLCASPSVYVTGFRSRVYELATGALVDSRVHGPFDDRKVYTVVPPSEGYRVTVVALDSSGAPVGPVHEQVLSLAIGEDKFVDTLLCP